MFRQQGFSLIELMMAIAIMGILMAVGLPAYNEYIIRSRLVEAHGGLSSGRMRAEQFYQDNRTYVGMPCPAAVSTFSYVCSNQTATTYTITANGTGKTAGFSFTINQDNTRATTASPSGWGTNASCWIIKKGGQCS